MIKMDETQRVNALMNALVLGFARATEKQIAAQIEEICASEGLPGAHSEDTPGEDDARRYIRASFKKFHRQTNGNGWDHISVPEAFGLYTKLLADGATETIWSLAKEAVDLVVHQSTCKCQVCAQMRADALYDEGEGEGEGEQGGNRPDLTEMEAVKRLIEMMVGGRRPPRK